jgi:hypothetical protein
VKKQLFLIALLTITGITCGVSFDYNKTKFNVPTTDLKVGDTFTITNIDPKALSPQDLTDAAGNVWAKKTATYYPYAGTSTPQPGTATFKITAIPSGLAPSVTPTPGPVGFKIPTITHPAKKEDVLKVLNKHLPKKQFEAIEQSLKTALPLTKEEVEKIETILKSAPLTKDEVIIVQKVLPDIVLSMPKPTGGIELPPVIELPGPQKGVLIPATTAPIKELPAIGMPKIEIPQIKLPPTGGIELPPVVELPGPQKGVLTPGTTAPIQGLPAVGFKKPIIKAVTDDEIIFVYQSIISGVKNNDIDAIETNFRKLPTGEYSDHIQELVASISDELNTAWAMAKPATQIAAIRANLKREDPSLSGVKLEQKLLVSLVEIPAPASLSAIEWLIKEEKIKDITGRALNTAVETKNYDTVELLIKNNATTITPSAQFAAKSDPKLQKIFGEAAVSGTTGPVKIEEINPIMSALATALEANDIPAIVNNIKRLPAKSFDVEKGNYADALIHNTSVGVFKALEDALHKKAAPKTQIAYFKALLKKDSAFPKERNVKELLYLLFNLDNPLPAFKFLLEIEKNDPDFPITATMLGPVLEKAMQLNLTDITDILIEHSNDTVLGQILENAIRNNRYDTAKFLLEHGAKITNEVIQEARKKLPDDRYNKLLQETIEKRIAQKK